jgi:hypothetical protein
MQAWQAAVQKVCLSFQQLQAVLGIRYMSATLAKSFMLTCPCSF